MRVGIIGTGSLAIVLSHRVAARGHDVLAADASGAAAPEAARAHPQVHAATVEGLARRSQVIVVVLPLRQALQLPPEPFIGRTVAEATDWFGSSSAAKEADTSAGRLLAEHLAGAAVVSVLDSANLLAVAEAGPMGGLAPQLAVRVAGDDTAAKAAVIDLLTDLGFDGVDAGDLTGRGRPARSVPALAPEAEDPRARIANV
jgi:predicted dinucleotide-binding enzyme